MEKEVVLRIENVSKLYQMGKVDLKSAREDIRRFINKEEIDPTRVHVALNGVTFDAYKGDRIGLLGKNGAGKSTLLKLICRITLPSQGYIGYNGRLTSMLETGTGFSPELTGRENIYLSGALLGMRKKEIDEKLPEIVRFSEIDNFLDTPIKRYSSGMGLRLGFAVSSFLSADIVVMDEVLAYGDIGFQNKCINKTLEIARREDRTIIYVSHNMDTIRDLCNRVIVLDKGKLVFDGSVEDGIRKYTEITEHD